jgi:hypothetical protein
MLVMFILMIMNTFNLTLQSELSLRLNAIFVSGSKYLSVNMRCEMSANSAFSRRCRSLSLRHAIFDNALHMRND